jgi:hypothetical protein
VLIKPSLMVALALCGLSSVAAVFAQPEGEHGHPSAQTALPTNEQIQFFEAKIRPVLVKNCYGCHSADAKDLKGDLLLDTRMGILQGGSSGPAIVPGKPDESLLIQALRYTDPDTKMPPKSRGGKLSDSIIQDFESWVKMGAPDPRDGALRASNGGGAADAAASNGNQNGENRKWWSYQPVTHPEVPADDSGWARSDIDRFIIAGLKGKGLKPVADVEKATLLRRIYFDLIGLPPTPEEADSFMHDSSPNAIAHLVDALLARPQFGERWGRHWLDVARYAESSGKDSNIAFPHAWRYRDYVIASFNSDKPYDQFIREQIAGDLLPASSEKKRAEQRIATGFLAIGAKSLNEGAARQFALDVVDEQVDATSQAFIGLTVSCARCHDHKFDPISQRDYYAAAGIFLSTKTDYGTFTGPRNRHGADLVELPRSANLPTLAKAQSAAERDKLKSELEKVTKEYEEALAERQEANRKGTVQENVVQKQVGIQTLLAKKSQLESELDAFDDSGMPKILCMGVEDRPVASAAAPARRGPQAGPGKKQQGGFDSIGDSPLFFRGEATQPKDRVPRGVPEFLAWSGVEPITDSTSGRKQLADWIASPKNPLTARVMANRLWHWLFGQGIVTSVDNFGIMGETPANPALLDYLATRLVENGWSVKKTIREIVLSRAYQLATAYDETSFSADPQNSLVWRHNKRRLDAECIRDSILSTSGQLSLEPLVGSAVAMAGDGLVTARRPGARGNGEEMFVDADNNHRSVYLPIVRDLVPDVLSVFDEPDPSMVTGAREATNVAPQALFLLNSDFVRDHARHLAERVIAALPAPASIANAPGARLHERVTLVFRIVLGRAPTAKEQNAATKFFQRLSATGKPNAIDTWTDFCTAIYNTAEFRYLD